LWDSKTKTSWLQKLAATGVEIATYEFIPGKAPDYYYAHLEVQVRDLYRKWGDGLIGPTRSIVESGTLAAYLPFDDDDLPGFALPIFISNQSRGYFIQIVDEISGDVKCLRLLDPEQRVMEGSLPSITVAAGDAQVYIFCDHNKKLIVGSISDIKIALDDVLLSEQAPLGVLLQITEIIGTLFEKQHYRRKFESKIMRASTNVARDSFLKSMEYSELWDRQLSAAQNEADKYNILRNRGKQELSDWNEQRLESQNISDFYEEKAKSTLVYYDINHEPLGINLPDSHATTMNVFEYQKRKLVRLRYLKA
jgi:hypothetical protein